MKLDRLSIALGLGLLLGCNDTLLRDGAPPEPAGVVSGTVRSVSGEVVQGAIVSVGDRTVQVDDAGRFLIDGVSVGQHNVYARSDAWSTGHRRVQVSLDGQPRLDIRVAPALEATLDDAAAGGLIDGDDGVKIDFPAGSIVHPDGQPVVGPVTVRWTLLNTTASIAAAPGEMLASTGGDEFPLESFGMVEVELSQAGAAVELDGVAELSIPLAATAAFQDGETVGLWHFDEDRGIWTLEGEGTVADGLFVADVPHFSVWNCDMPMQTTCVEGTLLTPDNRAYEGPVSSVGVDYMGIGWAQTDASGKFLLNVRTASTARVTLEPGWGTPILDYDLDKEFETNPTATGNSDCTQLGILVLTDMRVDDDQDGVTLGQGDCDDSDPSIYPGAPEVLCDGLDDDCDGVDSLGPDTDSDGSPDCFDCDDSNQAVHPEAGDVCDLIPDNDCDGVTDPRESDDDGDGVSECGGDCDDGNADVLDQCAFLDLSLAENGGCGVRPDSSISCWGDQHGDSWLPPIGTFTAVAVTSDYACGLRVDFGLECWDEFSVWSPAAWGNEASLLTASMGRVCGNQSSGTVVCDDSVSYVSAATEVADLAGGDGGLCWISELGRVFCAGNTLMATPSTEQVWKSVAVGGQFGCAVDTAGQPACWGPTGTVTSAVPAEVAFVSLSAGRSHVCGLTVGGQAVCWGADTWGQSSAPDGEFIAVYSGADTSCGTRPGGLVVCWGRNDAGQYVTVQ